MPAKRYRVILTEEERVELADMLSRGKERARKLAHARILLEADESEEGGKRKDAAISEIVRISVATIERVRKQFVEEGFERSLNHKLPSQGRKKILDGRVEANITQIACSEAPEGRARWTIQLIADELVKLEVVESISRETVRQGLKKTNLSLG